VYAVGVSFLIASVSLFFLNKFFYYTWYWIPSADFGITLYLLFSMKFLWRYVILLLPPAVLFPYIDFHWFIGIRKTPINEVIDIGTWFSIGTFGVNITFLFDTLSIIMLFVITSISLLVHIYSLEYMSLDPELPAFMGHLSLFTFFMLLLVSAGNMLQMFVGWEGVGLSSYFLINFWNTRVAANKAAVKAIVVNKFGDFSLMLAMGALAYSFNSLDYHVIFNLASLGNFETINLFFYQFVHPLDFCCLLLLGGAIAKSAQLGFHTWLPDAMEGPSPVSALIHAATMVTAGIFLLCRCSPILEYAPVTLSLCVLIGSLTAFFAASAGFFQNDI